MSASSYATRAVNTLPGLDSLVQPRNTDTDSFGCIRCTHVVCRILCYGLRRIESKDAIESLGGDFDCDQKEGLKCRVLAEFA
ncbi:hypothetical protein D3C85_1745220 [compost metagenome]